jgi:hypothetical protein
MKPIFLFLIALTVFWLSGCNESTQPNAKEVFVSIEIESAFQNDLVRLILDNKTLLESRVTTNYTVSLAWSSGLRPLSNDAHSLYFEAIEYGAHNSCSIDLTNDTSTVTISFDRSRNQVIFRQFKGRLLRD